MRTVLQRFWRYQHERFPLIVLTCTTLSVTLSSIKALSVSVTPLAAGLATLAGILYLFHIRVLDERRDYAHDGEFHPDRPVQAGRITLAELGGMNSIALGALLLIALYSGLLALLTLAVSL